MSKQETTVQGGGEHAADPAAYSPQGHITTVLGTPPETFRAGVLAEQEAEIKRLRAALMVIRARAPLDIQRIAEEALAT